MASIRLSKRAEDDVRALDPPIAARVLDAIERLVDSGQGDVKKLKGSANAYRLRVGDWRVRFERTDSDEYTIVRILHRRDAYRQ